MHHHSALLPSFPYSQRNSRIAVARMSVCCGKDICSDGEEEVVGLGDDLEVVRHDADAALARHPDRDGVDLDLQLHLHPRRHLSEKRACVLVVSAQLRGQVNRATISDFVSNELGAPNKLLTGPNL